MTKQGIFCMKISRDGMLTFVGFVHMPSDQEKDKTRLLADQLPRLERIVSSCYVCESANF